MFEELEDVYVAKTVVWKRPYLANVGKHIAIDDFCYFTTGMVLMEHIHIGPMVSVIGGAAATFYVGNFCTIGAGSRIIVRGDKFLGNGIVSSPGISEEYQDDVYGTHTFMHDFSSIGTNVILMPDVYLADGVVVGANSLVTKPITEPWTIWYGSPARKIKDRPKDKMIEFAKRLGYDYE